MKLSKPVIAVAVGSMFFSVYLLFFTGVKKSTPPASRVAPPAQQSSPDARVRIYGNLPPLSLQDLKWGRDPFSRPSFMILENIPTKSQKTAIKLEAIIEGKHGRVAIIDKEIVAKGDVVSGEKVIEISKDRVVLMNNGSKRMLSLGEAQGPAFARSKPAGEKK